MERERFYGGERQPSREVQIEFDEWQVEDFNTRTGVLRGGVLVETAEKRRGNKRFAEIQGASVQMAVEAARARRNR